MLLIYFIYYDVSYFILLHQLSQIVFVGIFANGHLKYDHERNHGPDGMPSLTNMTEKALEILKQNENGFVLVVEGGMIDQAHHRGYARRALSEVAAMDEAVKRTLQIMQ